MTEVEAAAAAVVPVPVPLTSTNSKRSLQKKAGDLDGSLHVSTHNTKFMTSVTPGDDSNNNNVEDDNSITEGTDDFGLLISHDHRDGNDDNNQDDNDDEDATSFCDADETCSADPQFCRRGMSVGPDELNDFMVEFGDEIAQAGGGAYYDDEDGDKIAVPILVHKRDPNKEEGGVGDVDDTAKSNQEEEEVLESEMPTEN